MFGPRQAAAAVAMMVAAVAVAFVLVVVLSGARLSAATPSAQGPSTGGPSTANTAGKADSRADPRSAHPQNRHGSQAEPKGTTAPVSGPASGLDPVRVRAQVQRTKRVGFTGLVGVSLIDGATGSLVYGENDRRPMLPASTAKLLTCAAALNLLGPNHRFITTVVSPQPGQLVLVGGGDPYLTVRPTSRYPGTATLTRLAARTAAALTKSGQTRITLSYDTSLFTGPAWNPAWPATYADQTAPTTALWVRPLTLTSPTSDPAVPATTAFAALPRKHGITVRYTGRTTQPNQGSTAGGSQPVASVASMPLHDITRQTLMVSDNNSAEVLLRHLGVTASPPGGRSGSITAGLAVLNAQLDQLGARPAGTVTVDGSGLARSSRVAPTTLARLLRTASSPDHPRLRPLVTDLPVAGVSGSLRTRFVEPDKYPAHRIVHGKTGVLNGVRTFAGYISPPHQPTLYYAIAVTNSTDDYAASDWIQNVLVHLAQCHCRRR